jgi:hypothetical protein
VVTRVHLTFHRDCEHTVETLRCDSSTDIHPSKGLRVDSASLTLLLTTVTLVRLRSSGLMMSPAQRFLSGGTDRSRNVVIRAGERASDVV